MRKAWEACVLQAIGASVMVAGLIDHPHVADIAEPPRHCGAMEHGICYKFPGYAFPNVGTGPACCAACLADTRCSAWTFIGTEVTGAHRGAVSGSQGPSSRCHLKTAGRNKTTCSGGVSSVLRPSPPSPPPSPPPPYPPLPPGPTPMNVLFLVVDDLRPEFNKTYGQAHLVTPHMDKFTDSSMAFTRAYVQYSHCSPSRNSFLSGRSPQTTGVYNFIDSFREQGVGPDWTTLPQMFKKSGFYVAGGGKVFHPGHPLNNDFPASWDVYYKPNGDDGGCRQNETIYSNVCPSAEPESAFYDYQLASLAVAQFKAAKNMSRPFFVAAGLRRPHRVWHVPKKYYDLYPNNGTDPTDIKLALHKTGPTGMPELAYIDNAWPSFRYDQNAPIPDRIAALGRWGYYAAVSFTDANLGLMLDALDELDLAKETVVALVGDHGWELGEHGEWCKRTNWEVGVRIPYMIRSPRHPETYGRQSAHFAEALDLYRTLAGLAGLPGSAVERGVEGDDLTPVFANASAVIKTAAYSQMARCPAAGTLGPESACNAVKLTNIKYMGISVRTELWRYTGWFAFNGTANRVVWGDLQGDELYSHDGDDGTDFDAFENENVADDPANAAIKAQLFALLEARWQRGHVQLAV